jgi:glycosyltransferase involved in cell wall biosynthesis
LQILPVSAVIPTRNRASSFGKALNSLQQQDVLPAELIVVDASEDFATREMLEAFGLQIGQECCIRWMPAEICGAAAQRNQGIATVTQPVVWFFDDDILFEPDCVNRLWQALQSDARLGGVNAMIRNQRYQPPGLISRTIFTMLQGKREKSFAGKVIGPAVNLLPEDRDDLPEVVPVEWLNTTCTMYRREALPAIPFDSVFTGYSLMEDLALSLRVGCKWRLSNARTARIFHDSQTGEHKSNELALATMELVNRHYIMTKVLGRNQLSTYLKLFIWELFQLMACAASRSSRSKFPHIIKGKLLGLREILRLTQRELNTHSDGVTKQEL